MFLSMFIEGGGFAVQAAWGGSRAVMRDAGWACLDDLARCIGDRSIGFSWYIYDTFYDNANINWRIWYYIINFNAMLI